MKIRIYKYLIVLLLLIISNRVCFSQNYETSAIPIETNNYTKIFQRNLLYDDGFLWYSTYAGIVKEMGNQRKLYKILTPTQLEKGEKRFWKINGFIKTDNEIWGASAFGAFKIDLETGKVLWFQFDHPSIKGDYIGFLSVVKDSQNNIWFSTAMQYIFCYTKDGEFVKFEMPLEFISTKDDLLYNIDSVLEDGSLLLKSKGRNRWLHFKNGEFTELKIGIKDLNDNNTYIFENGKYFSKNTSGYFEFRHKKYLFKYYPEIDKQLIVLPFSKIKESGKNNASDLDFIAVLEHDINYLLGLHFEKNNGKYVLKDNVIYQSGDEIWDMIRDDRGFFWISNYDDIIKARRIKSKFKVYLNQGEDSANKRSISTRTLIEDSKKNIYVIGNDEIFKKNKDKEVFEKVNFITNDSLFLQGLYVLNKQNDSIVWAGGYYNHIYKLNLNTKRIKKYKIPFNNWLAVYNLIWFDDENLLLATSFGLIEFNTKTKTFQEARKFDDKYGIAEKSISNIHYDKESRELYLGIMDEPMLYYKNFVTGEEKLLDQSTEIALIGFINCMHISKDGIIWLGTEEGLQKIDFKTSTTTSFRRESGVLKDVIAQIIENEGNIWVSTFNGIYKIDKNLKNLEEFYVADGLSNNEFNKKSSLKATDGTLYFGGIDGLTSFKPENLVVKAEYDTQLFLTEIAAYDETEQKNKNITSRLDSVKTINIPHDYNYASLKFATNDIFYPDRNTYQYRILEISEEWTNMGNNKLELLGLAPNDYTLEVRGISSLNKFTNTLKYTVEINQIFYKQKIFLLLAFAFILGLSAVFTFFRYKHLKNNLLRRIEMMALEAKSLRAQMNPHFLFNSINSLQSILFLEGEKKANSYLVAFSNLLRITLDISNVEYITIEKEIEYLKSYTTIQNYKIVNSIDIEFQINIPDEIMNKFVPCLVFQPIVENAMIHGLSSKEDHRKLTISFNYKGEYLEVIVEDNGIGREASLKFKKSYQSHSTRILNRRIKLSNNIKKGEFSYKIIDLKDDFNKPLGTKVVVTLPIK